MLTMKNELKKHEDEKEPLRVWNLSHVWKLTVDNIEARLRDLKTYGPDDMEKQGIHISNYCMFLWLKLQEAKK